MKVTLTCCEICKKEHRDGCVLPPDWITTTQNTLSHIMPVEKHFCSKACLIAWAEAKE